MKIILCDDDQFTLSIITDILLTIDKKLNADIHIVCKASSLQEVFGFLKLNPGSYLFFLDLDLGQGQLNGLDLARQIRKMDISGKIVFVTSHIEMGMDILKSGVEPFGFIEKKYNVSFMEKEFEQYISKYRKLNEETTSLSNTIELPIGTEEYISIPIEQISYVEALKEPTHNICYHTIDGSEVTVRETIAHAMERLGDSFVLSHRSIAVNKHLVIGVTEGQLKLSDGEYVPCALSRRKLFTAKKFL